MKKKCSVFVALLIVGSFLTGTVYATDWVSLSGTVKTSEGTPVCAMVLANGQNMFSRDPIGEYSLFVPLDPYGQITLYCFCEGMMPFKAVLDGGQTNYDISMVAAETDSLPWELYDDFESGMIDDGKWNIDSSSADITVENGQAKFVYTGPSDDSSWLIINQCPDDVIGIKAKVTMTSCDSSEDFRGRIGMIPGRTDNNYYWLHLSVRPKWDNIGGGLSLNRTADDYWLYDLYWGQFKDPIQTVQQTYTMSVIYESDKITLEVEGQGKQIFQAPEQFASLSETFKAIGIRGCGIQNQAAQCTVFFDDVYVMRTQPCVVVQ